MQGVLVGHAVKVTKCGCRTGYVLPNRAHTCHIQQNGVVEATGNMHLTANVVATYTACHALCSLVVLTIPKLSAALEHLYMPNCC